MIDRLKQLKPRQHILIQFIFSIAFALALAFSFATPKEIILGMQKLFFARDVLITDYFVVGGIGAAFFNSAILMSISLAFMLVLKMNFSGTSIAAFYIMGGFALFGKNPFNITPILFGAYLYAKMQGVKFNRYVYVALFATGLAPIVTELSSILPWSRPTNVFCGILAGIIAGYIIVPLAAHTISMHQGYSLFNVGFAAGLIALPMISTLKTWGFTINTTLIWHSEMGIGPTMIFMAYFSFFIIFGLILCDFKIKPFLKILKHPGRSIADFILMDGAGATFVNMGIVGIFSTLYIVMINGSFSGPVVGAIITIMGFSAFGIHIKNFSPVLVGVVIATALNSFNLTDPAVQLAAIFSASLAPIAGQFGILPGMFAGFLHTSIVAYIGTVYGGMNLYNNGFAAGFVAILMIPSLESFLKRYTK